MKNHEVVPACLISSIAGVKPGECQKILRQLTKHHLVCYEHKKSEWNIRKGLQLPNRVCHQIETAYHSLVYRSEVKIRDGY